MLFTKPPEQFCAGIRKLRVGGITETETATETLNSKQSVRRRELSLQLLTATGFRLRMQNLNIGDETSNLLCSPQSDQHVKKNKRIDIHNATNHVKGTLKLPQRRTYARRKYCLPSEIINFAKESSCPIKVRLS